MVESFRMIPSEISLRARKSRFGFTGISFIGEYFFDGLLGVTAVNSAIGK